MVPSFDDPKAIAGHGTIALEVVECLPQVDLFVVPIGGGRGAGFAIGRILGGADIAPMGDFEGTRCA